MELTAAGRRVICGSNVLLKALREILIVPTLELYPQFWQKPILSDLFNSSHNYSKVFIV